MRKISKFCFILVLVGVFVACSNSNDVFFKYQKLPVAGWGKDSVLIFDVPIDDINSTYNIYVNIRNDEKYSYQNFWFFSECVSPRDSVVMSDSIECYLADDRGKWLGTGVGAAYEMPVVFGEKISFDTVGVYQFRIKQGMREDILTGIQDLGLRLEKNQ